MKLMKVYLGERSKFAVVSALLVPCDVIDFYSVFLTQWREPVSVLDVM